MQRRMNHSTLNFFKRSIMLRPENTPNPARYPQGFVPLDGSEPIESIYNLVKLGHFVAPLSRIETIHKVFLGLRAMCSSEFPIISSADFFSATSHTSEVLNKLLIQRDFWVLDDFNDEEMNQSFGIQNYFFDNYKWSQVLWKRFQLFVEEYYPISEHSHLLYLEYMQLIRSFSIFEEGLRVKNLLPKNVTLHPPYGVELPMLVSLKAVQLLKIWVENFRSLYKINSALAVRCGCGVIPLMLRCCNIPMVQGLDPRPRVIECCRKDAQTHNSFNNVSFRVAEMFPEIGVREKSLANKGKFDLITFYPDEKLILKFFEGVEDEFAPSASGFSGVLENFFDECTKYLSNSGVIAICCTNLYSILFPEKPNPIEYEVKVNRRFVILDYYDLPIQVKANSAFASLFNLNASMTRPLTQKLRAELWILHTIESLHNFGAVHGIPSALPLSGSCNNVTAAETRRRQRILRAQVEMMGGDWESYKTRLITMLQEQSDTPEDDVAESVRMALDPTYASELAERAKNAVEERLKNERRFHKSVSEMYTGLVSPRIAFDQKMLPNSKYQS